MKTKYASMIMLSMLAINLIACTSFSKKNIISEIDAVTELERHADRNPAEVGRNNVNPQIKLDLSSCLSNNGTSTEVSTVRLQCIQALGFKLADRIMARIQLVDGLGDKIKAEKIWKLVAVLVSQQRHGILSSIQSRELQDKINQNIYADAATYLQSALRLTARGGDMRNTGKLFGVAVDLDLFAPYEPSAVINGCPTNSKSVYKCRSTPEAGDHESAAGMFDSIEICTGPTQNSAPVIFEKSGLVNLVNAAVKFNTGGVSYSTQENDLKVNFTVAGGINPVFKEFTARFSIALTKAKLTASSTYRCNKF